MRTKLGNELLLLNITTVLVIIVITFFPSSALRIVLGLPLVLFFPGYTLIAALFPRKDQLTSIERVALSLGLSLVVVPSIGFLFNFTPWGIRLYPLLIAIAVFILAFSLITWYRRSRLPEVERFAVYLTFSLSTWRGQSFLEKILSAILLIAILGVIGTLGYVIALPKVGESFTEFYILGSEGKAEGYPKEVVLGGEIRVTIGIINREGDTATYRVEATIDGARYDEIGPIVLHHEDRWEEEVGFMPAQLGDNQKVEFFLYRQGQTEVYRSVHLWVNIKPSK